MESQLISFLQLLRPIPLEDHEIINSYFTPKEFKEGDFLLEEGKVCREMFFVSKGVLRIASINDKAVELTYFFYKENHFCSVLQSFNDETPSGPFIQACCDAEVLCISKKKLHELYKKLPYMKELIDQFNQLHLIDKINIRNHYLGEDAENKYKIFITQNPEIALRVSLKDIASYLGITPQSLSRIRKNIK